MGFSQRNLISSNKIVYIIILKTSQYQKFGDFMREKIVTLFGLLLVITSASIVTPQIPLVDLGSPTHQVLKQIKNCKIQEQNECVECQLGFALNEGECGEPSFPNQCTQQTCGQILPVFIDELVVHPKRMKTDGEYFYYKRSQYLYILKGYPAQQMALFSTIEISEIDEFYFSEKYLFIITSQQEGIFRYGAVNYTHVTVYDISDKTNPVLAYSYTLNGRYLSSKLNANGYLYVTASGRFSDQTRPYFASANLETKIKYNVRLDPTHPVGVLGTINGERLSIMSIHKDSPHVENIEIVQIERDSQEIVNLVIGQFAIYYSVQKQTSIQIFKIDITVGQISPFSKHTEFLGSYYYRSFQFDEKLQLLKIVIGNQQQNSLYLLNTDLQPVGRVFIEGVVARLTTLNRKLYVRMHDGQNSLRVYEINEDFSISYLGSANLYGYSYNYLVYQEDRIIALKRVMDAQTKQTLGFRSSIFDISDFQNVIEISRATAMLDPALQYKFIHEGALFNRLKNLMQLQYEAINGQDITYGSFYFYVDRNLMELRQLKPRQDLIQNTEVIEENVYGQSICYIMAEQISSLKQVNVAGLPC